MILFSEVIKTWNAKFQCDRRVSCSINIDNQVYLSIETLKTNTTDRLAEGCVTMSAAQAKELAESILRGLKLGGYNTTNERDMTMGNTTHKGSVFTDQEQESPEALARGNSQHDP
jgi:hypothetical protein